MRQFLHLLQEYTPVRKEAGELLSEICKRVEFKEKELLYSPNEREEAFYFLNEGIIRHYYQLRSSQWTSEFNVEGEIILLPGNVGADAPQEKYIEAYTPVSSWKIGKKDFVCLTGRFPEFQEVFNRLFHQKLLQQEGRLRDAYNFSAQIRYQNFLTIYPGLANRVRVKHLASYLGINADTLSRIRKELSRSK